MPCREAVVTSWKPEFPGYMDYVTACCDEMRIKKLTFKSLEISYSDAEKLSRWLEHNRSLEELNLLSNNLCDESVGEICKALKNNTNLRRLSLRGNEISDEGAKAIGELLKGTNFLKRLDLSKNCIGFVGAACAISEGLARNRTLRSLNLSSNLNLCDESVGEICKALKNNTNLRGLSLRGNEISDEGAKAIGELLKGTNFLKRLDLSKNCIGFVGACAISKGLARNRTLRSLNLSSNRIDNGGAELICKSFHISLMKLDLSFNHISDEYAKCLKHWFKTYSYLDEFVLQRHEDIRGGSDSMFLPPDSEDEAEQEHNSDSEDESDFPPVSIAGGWGTSMFLLPKLEGESASNIFLSPDSEDASDPKKEGTTDVMRGADSISPKSSPSSDGSGH